MAIPRVAGTMRIATYGVFSYGLEQAVRTFSYVL